MKYIIPVFLFIYSITACTSTIDDKSKTDSTKFINTFIGTDGYGKTFPGAALPYSMLQVSPENGWSNSYNYEKEQLIGFSHMHLSGLPNVELPNLTIMPTTKKVVNDTTGGGKYFLQGFMSSYQHANEQAVPGYYAINLTKEEIFAEVTLKKRTALHSYFFSKKDTATILLDIAWSSENFINSDAYMYVEDDSSTVVGYRIVNGKLPERKLYFAVKFSEKITNYSLIRNGNLVRTVNEVTGKFVCGSFNFANTKNEPILVKTAFSSINEEAALGNLTSEMNSWNFETVKENAKENWNNALSKINIKTNDLQVLTNFYSALYRTMLSPNIFSDYDDRFLNVNGTIERKKQYHNISFKNSFNSLLPLLNLTEPQKTEQFINSALSYQANKPNGSLPGFLHWSQDIDNTSVLFSASAISAAWLKGINSYNGLQALNSFDSSIFVNSSINPLYKNQEYVAYDNKEYALNYTLTNSFNEWSISKLAQNFNDSIAYKYHLKRSSAYKSLFNENSMRFDAKNINNEFITNLDTSSKDTPIYAEQFKAIHALDTLINYYGSFDLFERKLDSLFAPIFKRKKTPKMLSEINLPENDFFFHAAYLYNKINKPEKTQKLIRILIKDYFNSRPDGLPTADASGKISAWYVFSALGIFPLNPVNGTYEIGSPTINQATLQLPNGNTLDIKVLNQNEKNIFVQSISLNNIKIDGYQITYEQILEGGELVFEMTNRKQLVRKN